MKAYAIPMSSLLLLLAALLGSRTSPAQEQVLATIRVLHHNIYGRDKAHCKDRYRALADHVLQANPPYDIVSLNEHWNSTLGDAVGETCDSDVLKDALHADGRYADDGSIDRSRMSYPNASLLQLGGGNSLVTNRRITHFEAHTFDNSNRFPVAGYMRSEIEIAPGISVDFWTTHLESGSDGCGEKCHERELAQLAKSLALHASGNPYTLGGNPVLIAGDFNIGGPDSIDALAQHDADPRDHPFEGNPGYDFIRNYLSGPRDLWLEAHPQMRDSNDAYTYDIGTNPLAYDSGRERIDYLLAPTDPRFVRSELTVRVKSMEIVRWKTADGTPVSDHYGLDATLEIVRR
jgi:endonuclease/exonuclease/phosphatase family metal-dependent hydrolase